MNFKAWQTYLLISIVVVHLLIAPIGLLIGGQIYPNISGLEDYLAYSQCALLAVFAAFSRGGPWKRWGLLFAGFFCIVSVPLASELISEKFRFEWGEDLSSISILGLTTFGTVVAWLPIRYWIDVDDTLQTGRQRQFGVRHLLTATFLIACLSAWYRRGLLGLPWKQGDIRATSYFFVVAALWNMTALGFAAALLSTNHRRIGITVIVLSLASLALDAWGFPTSIYFVQIEVGMIGVIAVTILLWRLARIPSKARSVALPLTPIEQTE